MINHLKSSLGYAASITFGGMSFYSVIQATSSIVGLAGAILGALGAYFTFRIQYKNWRNSKK